MPWAIGTHPKRIVSGWASFVGQAQVHDQLYAPGDCRVRSVDGASSSLSMTAYAAASVKFIIEGLEKQLAAVEATQRKVVRQGVAVHMTGVWAGQRLRNRVLETHKGQKLRYAVDPLSESQQYQGTRDDRSARRKASARPSGKSHRAPTYM